MLDHVVPDQAKSADRADRLPPPVSIVINTNGRVKSLAHTLESLFHLDYDDFEVCVVAGPSMDGTAELLERYRGKIKVVKCPERNLSMSRNIGIRIAAGEIVAFIDDDAIPEPDWLREVVEPFRDPRVGGSGGLIYDNTGYVAQHRYVTCNRLGRADLGRSAPADECNYPSSYVYPAVTGTNSVFRRTALLDIGGFDEEFEYFLDETDVCCRLIDAGWIIRQLSTACVHHKFLPSEIRSIHRVTSPTPLIKNKVYFSIKHALQYISMSDVLLDCIRFVDERRNEHWDHIRAGHIPAHAIETFEKEAEAAWKRGLLRALLQEDRTRDADFFGSPANFRAFPRLKAEGRRRVIVFLSQSYPPMPMNGVSRYTHDIARALAQHGHTIHVLTLTDAHNTVDFEDGVWVHRLTPETDAETSIFGVPVPRQVAGAAAAYAKEIRRMESTHPIDIVEAPSWDVEALGVLNDRHPPVVVNVVTTLSHYLDTHPELISDEMWMHTFGAPIQELEASMFREADGIIAASGSIVESIAERYDVAIEADRRSYVPHLSSDLSVLPRRDDLVTKTPGKDRKAVLFVGRLELRKGIDLLLESIQDLLDLYPSLEFWIAGDHSQKIKAGKTAKESFEKTASSKATRATRFLGAVTDEQLRGLYHACDLVVIPSRFESYGLVAIEAMMFAKPVVAAKVGGLAELVDDGATGLLFASEDRAAMVRNISKLIADPRSRSDAGRQARAVYDERYNVKTLAQRRLSALSRFFRTKLSDAEVNPGRHAKRHDLPWGHRGLSLERGAFVELKVNSRWLWLKFWMHAWSGIVELRLDGIAIREIDLYSIVESAAFVEVLLPRIGQLQLHQTARRNPASNGDQAYFLEAWQRDNSRA